VKTRFQALQAFKIQLVPLRRGSFKDLNFVGGEEDAQDAWRDKWEAHRRASVDEGKRGVGGSSSGGGGSGSGGGGVGGVRPIPIHRAGDVYAVALGRGGGGGGGASSLGAASSLGVGTSFPTRVPPLVRV
jgi:hypothetical protein